MNVLGLDTACSACSAALLLDGTLAAHRFEAMQRGHVEALMPMVAGVLEEAGAGYSDLDAIAATVGPGSFTGLRAGLAAAQGIAKARDIPLLGVTTLEAVAFAAARHVLDAPHDAALVIALETKRADLYLQCFAFDLTPLSKAVSLLPGDAAGEMPDTPLVLAGDGAVRLHEVLAATDRVVKIVSGPGLPDARDVARLAADRFRAEGGISGARPAAGPVYLHPPHVTMPGGRPGGRPGDRPGDRKRRRS